MVEGGKSGVGEGRKKDLGWGEEGGWIWGGERKEDGLGVGEGRREKSEGGEEIESKFPSTTYPFPNPLLQQEIPPHLLTLPNPRPFPLLL